MQFLKKVFNYRVFFIKFRDDTKEGIKYLLTEMFK